MFGNHNISLTDIFKFFARCLVLDYFIFFPRVRHKFSVQIYK